MIDIRRELQSGRIPPTRSPKYTRWVKQLPCICCLMQADDPHHRYGRGWLKGASTKVSDLWTIPLCRIHHDELHADVEAWEERYGPQWFWICVVVEYAMATGILRIEA